MMTVARGFVAKVARDESSLGLLSDYRIMCGDVEPIARGVKENIDLQQEPEYMYTACVKHAPREFIDSGSKHR